MPEEGFDILKSAENVVSQKLEARGEKPNPKGGLPTAGLPDLQPDLAKSRKAHYNPTAELKNRVDLESESNPKVQEREDLVKNLFNTTMTDLKPEERRMPAYPLTKEHKDWPGHWNTVIKNVEGFGTIDVFYLEEFFQHYEPGGPLHLEISWIDKDRLSNTIFLYPDGRLKYAKQNEPDKIGGTYRDIGDRRYPSTNEEKAREITTLASNLVSALHNRVQQDQTPQRSENRLVDSFLRLFRVK